MNSEESNTSTGICLAVQVQAKPTATTVLSTGSGNRPQRSTERQRQNDAGLWIVKESWCVSLRFVESYWHSKSICRIGTCLFVFGSFERLSRARARECYLLPISDTVTRDTRCTTIINYGTPVASGEWRVYILIPLL